MAGERSGGVGGVELALLALAALAVLGGHALGAALAYARPVYDHATGSWFVLATDLLDGTLYRPFVSEIGLGGTRYFPLFPVLLAGVLRLGLDAFRAGLLINVIAWGVALAGAYAVLRAWRVDRRLATVFGVFAVGSYATLMVMTSARGDLLPVAIALWGLYAAIRAGETGGTGRLALSAVLFTLAMAAKVTALFWPAAVIVHFASTRRIALAVRLALLMLLGVALFVVTMQWASHGRFLDMMIATSGGGRGWMRFIQGPLFFETFTRGADPLCFLAILASLTLLATRFGVLRFHLASALFAAMVVMTAAILGSHGTVENHLIDVNVAAMLLVATRYDDLRTRLHLVPIVLLAYGLLIPARFDVKYARSWECGFRRDAERHLEAFADPVLCEHPGIPIAIGRRPYLADAFMVNTMRTKRPQMTTRLRTDVEAQIFNVIVLAHLGAVDWYENVHFGDDFVDVVERHYVREKRFGHYQFFVPRQAGADAVSGGGR